MQGLFAREIGEASSWDHRPSNTHNCGATVATGLAAMGIPNEDRDAILNATPRYVGKSITTSMSGEREKMARIECLVRLTFDTFLPNPDRLTLINTKDMA